MKPNTVESVLSNVRVDDSGCWLWQGRLQRDGYGVVSVENRSWLVHRFFYVQLVGEVPVGLELDHLCRRRECCRPDHLEPVSHGENMRRGFWSLKTHCVNGHEFDEANTYVDPTRGRRDCRACTRERQRRYKERKAS